MRSGHHRALLARGRWRLWLTEVSRRDKEDDGFATSVAGSKLTQCQLRAPTTGKQNMESQEGRASNEDHAPRRCSRGTASIDVGSSSGMTRLHLGGASQHRARVTCRFFQHQTRMACTHDSVRIFMRAADLGTSQPTAVAAATPAWSTKQGSHTS